MVLNVREILLRTFICTPFRKNAYQAKADLVAKPCLLHIVTVCAAGNTDALIILRDDTTIIAQIDGSQKGTYRFDANISTKLTLEITGTSTPPDVTIMVGG